ncbi:efflux RND transporter periplasmic adaptor subunit [candidate division KSB1 bacterium]|nr:efflux RND transporter periplasmic adaptor subunit [candidate division KSB1 bacterium]
MKRALVIILLVGAILQLVAGCTKENSEARSMEQIHKEEGVPVEVTKVIEQPIFAKHAFHSVLSGIKETTASAMIADKVEKVCFSVGDRVAKDAVVITFPTDNPAAQYFQAKVAYEHAEGTLKRMKNLYEKGGISLQDFENTQTQFKVSKANWDAVQQTVNVKAPISGIISSINVQEADNVKSGDKLFTVTQTRQLKARVWVSEEIISDIVTGNAAIALWQGIELKGKVAQVDLSLNSKNQAFGVVVEFDNPGQRVSSGVNAEIRLLGNAESKSIVTERKNIVKEKNHYYVFIARNDIAVKRKVVLGREQDVNIEILQGIAQGELLITKGQMLLEDNTKIRIVSQ